MRREGMLSSGVSLLERRRRVTEREGAIQHTRTTLRMCSEVGVKRALCEQQMGEGSRHCQGTAELEKICFGQVFCPDLAAAFLRCLEANEDRIQGPEDVKKAGVCKEPYDALIACLNSSLERANTTEKPQQLQVIEQRCGTVQRDAEHCLLLAEHAEDDEIRGRGDCLPYIAKMQHCVGEVACPELLADWRGCRKEVEDMKEDADVACESHRLDFEECLQETSIRHFKAMGIPRPKFTFDA